MQSCHDLLLELREKIRLAEDNLRSEKNNFVKIQEMFSDEKTKWAAEIREEELKVQGYEVERRRKEAESVQLKAEFEEVAKKAAQIEKENEKMSRELRKAKTQYEEQQNVFLLEQVRLEVELNKLQEQYRDLQASNKWAKISQAKELAARESEKEDFLREDLKLLSDEFARKMDAYNESLKEIDLASFEPKKQKLAELRETLKKITDECKEYEEKNRALEKQIYLLKTE